jgi:hypothetical protein
MTTGRKTAAAFCCCCCCIIGDGHKASEAVPNVSQRRIGHPRPSNSDCRQAKAARKVSQRTVVVVVVDDDNNDATL